MAGKNEFRWTVVSPQDRCRQTAMFLWWFPPVMSFTCFLMLYYFMFPFILIAVHEKLRDGLHVLTGKKKEGKDKAPDSVTQEDASDPKSKQAPDPVIQNGMSKPNSKQAPVISTMTPAQRRELSHIFVQQTFLVFLIQPFLVLFGCLLANNFVFCDRPSRGLEGLWYMLWALIPGYLSWGCWLVFYWGETATIVLGQDEQSKERQPSGVQMVLTFVAMPVPMAIALVVMGLYQGMVYLVEAVMNRGLQNGSAQATLQKDDSTFERSGEEEKTKDWDTVERPSEEEKKNL